MSKNDFRKRTTSRETESPNALKKVETNAPEQAGPKRDVFRRASEVQLFKMPASGGPEVPGPAHSVDGKIVLQSPRGSCVLVRHVSVRVLAGPVAR